MANETTTVYNYNQTQLPSWYETYLQNIAGKAEGLGGAAYTPYGGQRVADLTPDQQAAFAMVRDSPGYQQYIDQATRQAENVGGINFAQAAGAGDQYLGAGVGRINEGIGLISDAGARETAKTFDPYSQEALQYTRQGIGSTLGLAQPYAQNAAALSGLSAASPYFSAASGRFPDSAGAYMSPYTSLVTDRIADLGARNLSEKLLPSISDDFIRSGQYGSTAQRDTIGRALRDTQEAVLGEQARSLESGYGTAANIFGQDQSRIAGIGGQAGQLGLGTGQLQLDVGRTLADVGGSDYLRNLQAGQQVAGIGQFATQAQQEEAQRALQAGQSIGSLGTSMGQLGLGRGQLGLDAARGQADAYLGASRQFGALGQQQQDQNLRGAAALENIGQTQQNQNQRNLDVRYGNFQEQRDYPWQQLQRQVGVLQGQNVGGTQVGGSSTTQPGPSTLGQVGGIGLGIAGLANSGIFKAKGGAVKKQKKKATGYGTLPKRGIGFMAEAA